MFTVFALDVATETEQPDIRTCHKLRTTDASSQILYIVHNIDAFDDGRKYSRSFLSISTICCLIFYASITKADESANSCHFRSCLQGVSIKSNNQMFL